MKKLKFVFSPRQMIIWIFILILLLTVPEITKPSMSQTEAIVTMLCVEYVDDEVQIASTVLTPGQDKTANYQVYSGSGKNIAEAVEHVSLLIGKELGFAQCEIMAFGDNLCEIGVMPTLDYMTKTKKVGKNAVLINFNGEPKDFAETAVKLNTEKSLRLDNILKFDEKYILSQDSNIESFYRGYFSEISLGIMVQVRQEKEESDTAIEVQASTGAGESSTAEGPKSQQEEKKFLVNDGSTCVFKNGKKEFVIEPDMIKKINLYLNDVQEGVITIENVNDELYNDASVVFSVAHKNLKIKTSFDGEKPVCKFDIGVNVVLEEVRQFNQNREFLQRGNEFFTPTVMKMLEAKIKQDMQVALDYCIENEADLMNVFRNFYRKEYKNFKDYWGKWKEKYLNGIDYQFSVKVSTSN